MHDTKRASVSWITPWLVLAGAAGAATYEAPLDVRRDARARFTTKPGAKKARDGVRISFSVSAPTDVEVAVLDSRGRVVRHLAAGLLGKNAPAPFRKNSLRQEIVWDRRDDAGKQVTGGLFKVRVRLGSKPRLEKHLGRDGNTLVHSLVGLAVDKKGQLYVVTSEGSRGRSEMVVLDRNGKYLRTVMPYPANTPEERLKSVGRLEMDGERMPIVFNGHGHNLIPLTSGMKKQHMVFSPKGHLLMASAVGTICSHGPPRHLLAVHPEGGAPEGIGFVGPRILKPRGFMGGAGERGSAALDSLAASPDGRWIYLTTHIDSWAFKKLRHHAVFRLKWTDEKIGEPFLGRKETGEDDEHFNDPQGIATDSEGRIYVCDRGNNRVMVFSAQGKLLGKFAVEHPQQISVHPKSAEIYLLSRKAGRTHKHPGTKLFKFSPWRRGAGARELARLELAKQVIELFALDSSSSPARLWCALYGGWRRPDRLLPVTDRGTRLEPGETVLNSNGLGQPMYIAADPARGRVYVTERGTLRLLDLKTGKLGSFPKGRVGNAVEPAVDRNGNVYVVTGWSLGLQRYDQDGNPLPFSGLGTHKMTAIKGKYPGGQKEYICRASGVTLGARGHVIAANGDLYVLKMRGNGHGGTLGQLDVYGPDGKLKKEGLVARTVGGTSGLGLDPAGNVYIGSNLKPVDGSPLPYGFAGKVPEKGWRYWSRGRREIPWRYPYYNPYLFHWGAIFKFPPTGGEYFGAHSKKLAQEHPEVALEAPQGTPRFRSGYLSKNMSIWVKGALWRYGGVGPIPDGTTNWGDPSCCCWNSRFAIDGYGRVYAPNPFRFSVEMLDTNGNHLARIGRYGNADSAGPGSKVPEPEIAFGWPAFVSAAGEKLYVSDPLNRRVSVVRFEHAEAAECSVR